MKLKINLINSFARMMAALAVISLGLGIGLNFLIHNNVKYFDINLFYVAVGFVIFMYDYKKIIEIIENLEIKK